MAEKKIETGIQTVNASEPTPTNNDFFAGLSTQGEITLAPRPKNLTPQKGELLVTTYNQSDADLKKFAEQGVMVVSVEVPSSLIGKTPDGKDYIKGRLNSTETASQLFQPPKEEDISVQPGKTPGKSMVRIQLRVKNDFLTKLNAGESGITINSQNTTILPAGTLGVEAKISRNGNGNPLDPNYSGSVKLSTGSLSLEAKAGQAPVDYSKLKQYAGQVNFTFSPENTNKIQLNSNNRTTPRGLTPSVQQKRLVPGF